MNEYSKYYDILVDFRSLLFAGKKFDADYVKILKNRFRSKITGVEKKDEILDRLIIQAKNDFTELSVNGIQFLEIKELMELIKAINTQFLISEQSNMYSASKASFNLLNDQFRKYIYNAGEIKSAITVFEKDAKAWENKDQKHRLFELLRKYAKLCETLLLPLTDKNIQLLLSPDLIDIVLAVNSDINKNDFNPFKYKELSEKYVLNDSLRSISEEKRFPVIITLISLKCKSSNIEVPSITSTVTCPKCGNKEQSGSICTNCHAYIKCPGCGHAIAKDAKICGGCGVEIETIGTWLNKINDADKKISAGDYESAGQLINPIKLKWAKNESITTLLNKIAELRTKTIDCEKKVDECLAKSNYFTAQKYIAEIKRTIVLPDNLHAKEKDIKERIEQAQTLVGTGDKQSTPIQKMDYYAQAVSLTADFDEAVNKLKRLSIVAANFVCQSNEKQVQLRWEKITCHSLSVKYIISKEDITNRNTKTEITRTATADFTDTIDGGISYFYYIQIQYNVNGTDISGVWDEVKSAEIITPTEVAGYRAFAGDRKVRIEFTPHPNAVDYELHRSDGTEKKEILKANLRSGNFTDTEIKNGVRYTYTLIAIFKKSSGEIIRSKGIETYATPLVPPQPVQSLDCSKNGEIVTLSWDGQGKSNDCYRILHAATPMNKPIGFSMPLAELEKSGKVVIPLTSSKSECALLNHAVRNYFSIWSIFGDMAIIGAEVETLNVNEVSNAKVYISSGKLYVEWDWPSNCNLVRISYSNDSHTDRFKIIKNYPRELYDKQKAFIIQPVMDKDYYIEISTMNFEGKQEIVSSGIKIKLTNSSPMTIKYALKVSSFLGKKLKLAIENDNNKRLPELILVSSPGQMPGRKEDGAVIYVIPGGTACGTFELPNEHIRKNYYARLFLSDTSVNNIKIITPNIEQLKLY